MTVGAGFLRVCHSDCGGWFPEGVSVTVGAGFLRVCHSDCGGWFPEGVSQ